MSGDDISGKQLAEILKFLAGRVQEVLDEGQDIVEELKKVASKLEHKPND